MSQPPAGAEQKGQDPGPTGRPMTLDEAMALAITCLRHDQHSEAEIVLRSILEVAPDHADALHFLGMVAHKRGRSDEAVALMRRSLDLVPDQADWHSNLGIVLQARDELEPAIDCFERALALNPAHANALNNLGVLFRVFQRHEEAETAYRRVIELDPSHADAYHNLAIVLDLTGRTHDAIIAYSKALTLKPEYPEVRRVLALAYCAIDERDKAIKLCEAWLDAEPDDPVARHTLAAVSNRDVPARAEDAYVQRAFDSFSTTFEAKLARLDYRAPDLVLRSLRAAGVQPAKRLDVLDAGCGTGLCAPLLAPYARRMTGVDLSAGMLRHAADKGLYDDLVQAELTGYVQQHRGAYDVIVSADTLVYFGALEDVVAAAAQALRPGGILVFTVEEWIEQDAPAASGGYCLRPHGRYNHRASYVDRLLREAGLEVQIDRDELRKEQGIPVAGLIVRAVKPRTGVSSGVDSAVATAGAAGEPHA